MANTKQKPVDLTGWPTQGEVMETLGISDRTLNRLVEQNKIQRDYKAVPGRRPVPVFHPGDVEKYQAEVEASRTFVMPHPPAAAGSLTLAQARAAAIAAPQSAAEVLMDAMPVIAEAFATVAGNGQAKPLATYVKIDEAEIISGLPRGYLLELAQEKKIKAIKRGSWYFQRKALENL